MPITPTDGLIRSAVLPGLQFRVSDLVSRPGPEAMSRDPVYWDFVLPGWRRLEQQAREAAARAEAEAQARLPVPPPRHGNWQRCGHSSLRAPKAPALEAPNDGFWLPGSSLSRQILPAPPAAVMARPRPVKWLRGPLRTDRVTTNIRYSLPPWG